LNLVEAQMKVEMKERISKPHREPPPALPQQAVALEVDIDHERER
jgi:hypothetical protein